MAILLPIFPGLEIKLSCSKASHLLRLGNFLNLHVLMNILRQKYERWPRAQEKSIDIIKDKFAGIITQYDRHRMAWAQIILICNEN